jgi:hypothetical protein
VKRTVTVRLGAVATEALTGEAENGGQPKAEDVLRAINFYLSDGDGGRAGWRYPEFLRGRGLGGKVDLRLDMDNTLWRALAAEAKKQDVSVEQLVEHAVLYYAAELDAGRVAERMLGNSGHD